MARRSGLRALSRPAQIVLLGGIVNSFGTGLVIPFFGIYLREGAGLSISKAGLVLAVFGLSGIAATPVVGQLVDRIGSKTVCLLLLAIAASGFGAFVAVHDFPTAIAAAVLAGVGNGGFWPAQSTLLSALTRSDQQTVVFAANRAAMNMGIGLGGVVGGFIAVNGHPSTYDRLFIIDVVTFLLFAGVVATIHVPQAPVAAAHEPPPSFRSVLAVPFFRRLLAVDLATAVTFSLAFELLPIHAAGRLGIANHVIGGFFLVNTFAVAFAQLPMVRILQGRRRMPAYELMHVVYAAGLLAILLAPALAHSMRLVLLGLVMLALGVAETVYGAVRPAIVTELFPPAVLGRAFALSTTVLNIGMSATRAGGGALLDRSPSAPWIVGAAICLAAAIASKRMERIIPAGSTHNPLPTAETAPAPAAAPPPL